jgi:hypothetical protein
VTSVSGFRWTADPGRHAGGNPQIAKADGDAPVQACMAAMPGWKRDVGRRLDALIVRTIDRSNVGGSWQPCCRPMHPVSFPYDEQIERRSAGGNSLRRRRYNSAAHL